VRNPLVRQSNEVCGVEIRWISEFLRNSDPIFGDYLSGGNAFGEASRQKSWESLAIQIRGSAHLGNGMHALIEGRSVIETTPLNRFVVKHPISHHPRE
jgi:hypothetical protein